ncbi:Predicted dehydrogenase [Spirosomataceae bacterium TFI 002]|nr:Predicted dehydrogenase [Spirosomataceae bacterium TFI 002]
MIKVGLVGFGLSGRWLQAPFFSVHPAFHLKSIVTSQEIPKEVFPLTGKASSFEELLADPELDLISICTPNFTHFEYAKRVLEAGKHVLVEKPMTATYEEAQILVELAKSKNKVLTVYQNRRFDSDFMTLQRVIQSGMLGEIHTYEARYDRYKPDLHTKQWKEATTPGSGILYDLGAHIIDQAIYLFGTPDEVDGEVFIQREGSQIDDAFDIRMVFGKVRVMLKSSLLMKEQAPRYAVHGLSGSLIKNGIDVQEDHLKAGYLPGMEGFGIEPENQNAQIFTNIAGLELKGTIDTMQGNWMYLFQNLADAIEGKAEIIIKPEQVAEQIRIIEKVRS